MCGKHTFERGKIEPTVPADGYLAHLIGSKPPTFTDSGMLDGADIEMADGKRRAAHLKVGAEHKIGRFRGPAGENHMRRIPSGKCGNIAPRLGKGSFCRATFRMH